VIERGPGSFRFSTRRDAGTVEIVVWTYRPARLTADAPVLFVLHGAARNGRSYRDAWIEPAERHGALVLAPEFGKTSFPTAREYEVGNMRDRERRPLPPDRWSFAIIEALFDRIREELGIVRAGYLLFGHSAGAQFVHRLLTFVPDCRAEAVVAANSGCYTLLDETERFPYGLGGMPVGDVALRRLLGRKLAILLGEDDADPDAPLLLKTPEAQRQGAHRLARGRTYYNHARELAARLGVPFAWRLVTLPGVGRSHRRVTPEAARLLLGDVRGFD